jgi:uncharacterized membrane protein YeaQ/YmgE (transglycosylase-associated protein family)
VRRQPLSARTRLITSSRQGFVLTTVLGIVGSVVATFLGRAIHLYGPDQGAGIIASIIGALIVLWGWHQMVRNR